MVVIIISCPVVAVVRQQTQTQRSQSFERTAGMRADLQSAGALRDEMSGGPWHGAPLADTGGPCPPHSIAIMMCLNQKQPKSWQRGRLVRRHPTSTTCNLQPSAFFPGLLLFNKKAYMLLTFTN